MDSYSIQSKNELRQTTSNSNCQREINFEELNIDVQDAAMVKTIENTLSSNDEIKQLFALEIIDGLSLSPWKKTIKKFLIMDQWT